LVISFALGWLVAGVEGLPVRYSVPGCRVEISTRVEGDKAIVSPLSLDTH
jgi:hypothetical protein